MEAEKTAFKNILASLSERELNKGHLSGTYSDILLGPGRGNSFPVTKQGLLIGELSKEKQNLMLQAIRLYVKDIQSEKVEKMLAANTRELDSTYIAYAGNPSLDAVGDYLRIDGPGVWIEYCLVLKKVDIKKMSK